MAFEDIWREHMPLDHDGARSAAGRTAFVSTLEVAVQRFVRGEGGPPPPPPSTQAPSQAPSQAGPPGQAATERESASSRGGGIGPDPEAAETAELVRLTNREVLRSELADARHRTLKHRERARWLEAELELANKKAAMWRGATPGSESERMQSLERELNYLQFGKRLRERLGDQRLALERLKAREQALTARLADLSAAGRTMVD